MTLLTPFCESLGSAIDCLLIPCDPRFICTIGHVMYLRQVSMRQMDGVDGRCRWCRGVDGTWTSASMNSCLCSCDSSSSAQWTPSESDASQGIQLIVLIKDIVKALDPELQHFTHRCSLLETIQCVLLGQGQQN